MSLQRKQDYFEYRGGWSYKQPPRLDHAFERRLHEIDPSLHLIWGGVAIIRNSPDGNPVSVLGDPRATKKFHGRLMARWLNQKVKTFRGYSFSLKDGRERIVMREDSIPVRSRELAIPRFEYTEFGDLRWHFCRFLTPERTVEAQIYAADDPDLPSEGFYYDFMPIETPDGLYWEPDLDWLDHVAKVAFETLHTPLKDLYQRDHDIREKQLEAQEEAAEKRTCIKPEDLLKFTIDHPRLL